MMHSINYCNYFVKENIDGSVDRIKDLNVVNQSFSVRSK